MIQEEKELLLKDLCARLPYGVICDIYNAYCTIKERLVFSGITRFVDDTICVRPYLFPLSSMTKEQKKEYDSIIYSGIELHSERYYDVIDIDEFEVLMDFYHKNHFDYRGFIPMGLAIDATNLNIY